MTPLFIDDKGFIIAVDIAPNKIEWTFYRKPDLKTRGHRFKPRSIKKMHPTEDRAIEALKAYAAGRRGWKPHEPVKPAEGVEIFEGWG